MVWMKPKMSAALQSAPISEALHTTPANACRAAIAETDCVKKRDPHGDEINWIKIRKEPELDSHARLKKRTFHTTNNLTYRLNWLFVLVLLRSAEIER